jgi:hypothetical protein
MATADGDVLVVAQATGSTPVFTIGK